MQTQTLQQPKPATKLGSTIGAPSALHISHYGKQRASEERRDKFTGRYSNTSSGISHSRSRARLWTCPPCTHEQTYNALMNVWSMREHIACSCLILTRRVPARVGGPRRQAPYTNMLFMFSRAHAEPVKLTQRLLAEVHLGTQSRKQPKLHG